MGKKEIKTNKLFERISFAVKIIFSLIIGFLPSFLYIFLFMQYGSPFLNYIQFLLDFKSSWGAWISAVVISFLITFIWKLIRSKKIQKIFSNKLVLIPLILAILGIIFLISLQSYLYVNFVLGSDVLLKLSADKDNIFFTDNSAEDIIFKTSLTMNPFCTAQCNYELFDISNGNKIETDSFTITSILSNSKKYTLNNHGLIPGSQELIRFEVVCKSKKTLLCYTSEEESKRSVLVTLNYDLSEEDKEFKNKSKSELILFRETLDIINNKLNNSRVNINSINNSFSTELFFSQSENLSKQILGINSQFNNLKNLWETQNFLLLKDEIVQTKGEIDVLNLNSNILNEEINLSIQLYNLLVKNMTTSRILLEQISQMLLSPSLCDELNIIIPEFNDSVQKFKGGELSDKEIIANDISFKINELYEKIQTSTDSGSACVLQQNINNEIFFDINIFDIIPIISELILSEPTPVCCFSGNCKKCCEDCSGENYPVVFLHGHSFNKALPADYSLDTFEKIKSKLVLENYIDAGALVISNIKQEGLWGRINIPIAITASYFFDTYQTPTGETTIVSSKTDGIDTYAIRLKNIIETLKARTNKNKVIIVAHSMGGVVARRYIQIFGGENIDKLILLTVPNFGVDDKIRAYCALIGPEASCNDLDKDSILMNRLNNAPTEIVPTYNIIGIGCNMGSETGDGIVKNSSQYLSYATNYYIKGSCNELGFNFLHQNILNPNAYPESYNTIKEILNNSNS
ncbi:hypothetical protein M0R19_01760 [Candidatus Pacearchaeota archaeon]|nr:hypothetical protein [Candidatus Pacearchaeota archaeon]